MSSELELGPEDDEGDAEFSVGNTKDEGELSALGIDDKDIDGEEDVDVDVEE
jgi:hypothetical protein